MYPEDQAGKRKVMAFLWMTLEWGGFFTNILPENANGTHLVMRSSCGFTATYEINGLTVDEIGVGDFHDPKYDDWEIVADFFRVGSAMDELPSDLCADQLTIHLYPTDTLKESTTTKKPILYAAAVAGIFLFTSAVFFAYDFAVRRRQRKVMARVITQDKIVSNLFPPTIRDRLYGIGDRINGVSDSQSTSTGNSARDTMDMNDVQTPAVYGAKPLADLFLETVRKRFFVSISYTSYALTRFIKLFVYRLSSLLTLQGSQLGVVQESQVRYSFFSRTYMEPLINFAIGTGFSKLRQLEIATLQ